MADPRQMRRNWLLSAPALALLTLRRRRAAADRAGLLVPFAR